MPANAINPLEIFFPVLAIIKLTFVALLRLAIIRTRAARLRADSGFYRAFIGSPEPEDATVAIRHYGNLFEPVLLYAGCLWLHALGAVTPWSLGWAWATSPPAWRRAAFTSPIICRRIAARFSRSACCSWRRCGSKQRRQCWRSGDEAHRILKGRRHGND